MWLETITRTIERSGALDSLGRRIGRAFSSIVRPGSLKDVLSGTWLAHPVHPMLTDVTIGAWTSSFLIDLLGGERGHVAADRLVLAGVASALPTAVTGLSDLSDVVHHEERSVGAAHALGNLTALSLYGLSYLKRREGKRRSGIALSTMGAAVAAAAGFLGGHLAYRRGIGVDQTAFRDRLKAWTPAVADDDLTEGTPRRVRVGTTDLFLYRDGDRIRAIANRCSHRGGPLHKGTVEGARVTCPWHLSTFDTDDGSVIRGPATAPQPSYETRVRDGQIEVRARS
jgi:nitrite reductase/ring-hydroxylating ferredoxin subunit/uncharacterized membrane protein